jgi:hypothetical protein
MELRKLPEKRSRRKPSKRACKRVVMKIPENHGPWSHVSGGPV